MKLYPSMIEAGAAVYETARAKGQNAEAVVTAVYSAMEEHRVVEEARRANPNHEKVVYQHKDWPAWRQSPTGERRIFQREEDVPEGWGKVGAVQPVEPANDKKPRKKAA